MREFFGFGGYARQPEGYLSWQHLTFVTLLMLIMTSAAILLGRRYRTRPMEQRNRVLMAAALLLDGTELFKIVMQCIIRQDPMNWLYELPLFLCSIQLIALPMAAFSRGRLKEAALDFVCIFGLLGAVLGTYAAGNNYASYPVLSFDNVASGITHALAGFASLYIFLAGMASMKRGNILITFGILGGFCAAAWIANIALDYNYMFLMRGDGTPYDLLYALVGGHPVAYPLSVIALFLLYIALFYGAYYRLKRKKG